MTDEEFEGRIHHVSSMDELMNLIGELSGEDKPRMSESSLPTFGNHRCNECKLSGHCPIEPQARYFGDKPEEEMEVLTGIKDFLIGDILYVLQAYFMGTHVTNPLEMQSQTLLILLTLGYITGKTGQPWPTITLPEHLRMFFKGPDPRD